MKIGCNKGCKSRNLLIYTLVCWERGIRTPGTVTRSPHFECGPFDHSGISPGSGIDKDEIESLLENHEGIWFGCKSTIKKRREQAFSSLFSSPARFWKYDGTTTVRTDFESLGFESLGFESATDFEYTHFGRSRSQLLRRPRWCRVGRGCRGCRTIRWCRWWL